MFKNNKRKDIYIYLKENNKNIFMQFKGWNFLLSDIIPKGSGTHKGREKVFLKKHISFLFKVL